MPSPHIYTYRGVKFYPLAPRPEDVYIEDIAHPLALKCRWGGHVRRFISIAEHSYWVSMLVPPEDQLAGLLHDGGEAYWPDIPRPIKYTAEMTGPREIEKRIFAAIAERFGIPKEKPESVKVADARMCITEGMALMNVPTDVDWELDAEPYPYVRINAWDPETAEQIFLARFNDLTKGDR